MPFHGYKGIASLNDMKMISRFYMKLDKLDKGCIGHQKLFLGVGIVKSIIFRGLPSNISIQILWKNWDDTYLIYHNNTETELPEIELCYFVVKEITTLND